MLEAAGVETETQLRSKGSAAAFVAVKRAGCRPSLNLLWAIEGALRESGSSRFYLRHGFTQVEQDEWDNYYVLPCPKVL